MFIGGMFAIPTWVVYDIVFPTLTHMTMSQNHDNHGTQTVPEAIAGIAGCLFPQSLPSGNLT